MAIALTGSRIFTGDEFLVDHAVLIEGRKIVGVCHNKDISTTFTKRDLGGGFLTPGFIDVQVNGGGGALLNDKPSVETVQRIAESHRKFGTTGLLPTVITDAPSVLEQAISAVSAARQRTPSILGIHIEGPFIDVARKGAHDAAFIRTMTDADVKQINESDCGVVMLTLAPNKVDISHIRQLADNGVLVSLGHAEASFEMANTALASGARAFTHLYNAMSQITGREPSMVGAALADHESYVGIIADGFHVHDAALKIALTTKSQDRFMLISDAMSSAAGGPSEFELQGRKVTLNNGRLQLDSGTLAGSNLTMDAALRYAVNKLGVSLASALHMASLNPARFLRKDHELGRIASGYLASLVHLDEVLHVKETWVEGA
jgi:N-acetylglucosamine-6-phosphate deacetylase